MKKLFPVITIVSIIAIAAVSCKETWTRQTKGTFYDACTEEAKSWAVTDELTKTYCDCVLDRMMQKYPHEVDALEHIDSLAKDPDLIKCKSDVMTQKQ